MKSESITWPLPLSSPPVLLHAAFGRPQVGEFRFHLPETWCAYLFLDPWRGESDIDGVPYPFAPRYAVVVPPGARQRYQFFSASQHLYIHFQAPLSREKPVPIRAAQLLGDDFVMFRQAFEKVAAFFRANHRRAVAHLWDLLWELALRGQSSPAIVRGKGVAETARRQIEIDVSRSLTVGSLASDAGVTPTHLSRLFRTRLGMPVGAYLRDCRVRKAQHLLATTTMPIKAIAHAVGLPDLQHFNKTIRRELGCSPRRFRERNAKK